MVGGDSCILPLADILLLGRIFFAFRWDNANWAVHPSLSSSILCWEGYGWSVCVAIIKIQLMLDPTQRSRIVSTYNMFIMYTDMVIISMTSRRDLLYRRQSSIQSREDTFYEVSRRFIYIQIYMPCDSWELIIIYVCIWLARWKKFLGHIF